MANLRELRKHAGELGIEYTKETKKEELMEKIAAVAAEKAEAGSSDSAAETKPSAEPETSAPSADSVTPDGADRFEDKGVPSITGQGSYMDDVAIDVHDVQDGYVKQPTLMGHYGRLKALAKRKMNAAKLRLKVVESELFKKYRAKLTEEGGGKAPAERVVNVEVWTDPAYKMADNQYSDAQHAYDMMEGIVQSFRDRSDMLIQIGADQRQEREQTGMSLHERAKAIVRKSS